MTRVREEYAGAVADAEQRIKDMHLQAEALREEDEIAARRHLLLVEKDTVQSSFRKGSLSQEVHDLLMEDIDARILHLDSM